MTTLQIFTPGYYGFPYLSFFLIMFGFFLIGAAYSIGPKRLKLGAIFTAIIVVIIGLIVKAYENEKVYFYDSPEYMSVKGIEDYHWNVTQAAFDNWYTDRWTEKEDSLSRNYEERRCQWKHSEILWEQTRNTFEARKRRMTIFNVLTIK